MPTVKAQIEDLFHKLKVLQLQIGGGGAGEANTGSNQGAGGVGPYWQKVGVDLQFRNINAASPRVSVALDAVNREIDIDVVPAQIDLDDLGDVNAPGPANDDVLTWNAATARWIAQAGGGAGAAECFEKYRKSGRYYSCDIRTYTLTTSYIQYDNIYAIPFLVPVQQSFDRIGINCNAGAANAVGRLGLYDDDGTPYPGNLIHGTAEFDFSGAGDKEEAIAETLDPGLYWLAILIGVAMPSVRAFYYQYHTFPLLGRDALNDLNPMNSLYGAEAYGVMPDPFPAGITERDTQNPPAIFLRKA